MRCEEIRFYIKIKKVRKNRQAMMGARGREKKRWCSPYIPVRFGFRLTAQFTVEHPNGQTNSSQLTACAKSFRGAENRHRGDEAMRRGAMGLVVVLGHVRGGCAIRGVRSWAKPSDELLCLCVIHVLLLQINNHLGQTTAYIKFDIKFKELSVFN